MDIEKKLSPEARAALIDFGGSRQGQRPPQGMKAAIMQELWAFDIVTRMGNLTNRGGLVRDRVLNDVLDTL